MCRDERNEIDRDDRTPHEATGAPGRSGSGHESPPSPEPGTEPGVVVPLSRRRASAAPPPEDPDDDDPGPAAA